MKPFFSIIIPCCDVEDYVRECLDSVLSQDFQSWECLVGVETSKDKTEEIVREYAAKDPRIRVFTGPRSGSCSESRNIGTDMAEGEYAIFLDGDDTIAEGSLRRIHDKIAARPGADLYPCAIVVYQDKTGEKLELRDNYPADFSEEMTGPESILKFKYSSAQRFCPMLQIIVFRREFLVEHNLKCIRGLRCQDSEFTPRALYLAKRVIPIHEQFYLYRIRGNSVQTSSSGTGYFLKDWAIILKSLFAFHANVSKEKDFDSRLTECWRQKWTTLLFCDWFEKYVVYNIPRQKRVETLRLLFSDGYDDFRLLMKGAPIKRKIAAMWVCIFVRYPFLRWAADQFFVRIYTPLTKLRQHT